MGIAQRIEGTIETWQAKWKDRLRGWMASWMTRGFNELMESLEPEAISLLRTNLTKISEHPATPRELTDMLSTLQAGKKPLPLLLLIPLGVLMLIPVITSLFQPLGNLITYVQERIFHSWRLDPSAVITAWRRDPKKYAKFFDDLVEQGWSEERIDALKFYTEIIPGVSDLIRMSVREAFSPEIAEKFGQYEDPPVLVYPWTEKLGLSKDWVDRYWAAHWELPSAGQGFELLHRGIITEDELKMLLRALDVMPYWRDKLIKVSWNVPTRVDIRRFLDMGTIDETRLRELYTNIGYHGKDLDDYVLWTKIYNAFPDLLARYKNGWITLDDVKRELIAMGMKPERADTMIEEKIKKAAPERVAKERDLTAAEIIKGIKKAVITVDQGVELLIDMGYDEWEAEYKVAIELAAAAGSPEKFSEFKELTERYRKAAGMEVKAMPEELKKAADEVVRLTKDVESLKRSIEEEQKGLIAQEILPEAATERLTTLQVTLHRAEAELARVKSDYDSKLAEWRHGG